MLSDSKLFAGGHGYVLDRELHDLSQPLSRLQCRLELALLSGVESNPLEVFIGALEDVRDCNDRFHQLRMRIAALWAEEVSR